MNLITFTEPLTLGFKKSAGGTSSIFEAGRPYMFTSGQTDKIMRTDAAKRRYRISNCDMRIESFNVKSYPNRRIRLLFFNGSGGYGDQIMTWPVAKILSEMHDVHVLTDPGNSICWWNFDFVKTVQHVPILWETVRMFDAFVPFETVVNMDEHQDQRHPVDVMLHKIGIDPESVPDHKKVVRPVFTANEMGVLGAMLNKHKRIGLYQMSASTPNRSLPASDSVFLLRQLAEATPEIHWLCLYDQFVPEEYAKLLACVACAGQGTVAEKPCPACHGTKTVLPNIEPFNAPNLRELWALTEKASVVVAPDSMMPHVAGMFGVPCVGLWGPMSPQSRVRYYQNHRALYPKEFCPHSPCFVYNGKFPHFCPPRPGTRTSCDVLSGISPSEVIAAVREIRR